MSGLIFKCCGTVSSSLFCLALRCSPNLSLKARLVCPMYSAEDSAGVFGMLLHLRHWIKNGSRLFCNFFKPESVGKIFTQPKANSQIDDGFNYSTTGKT